MVGHHLCQIGMPLRLATGRAIGRPCLLEPARGVMVMLRSSLMHDRLCLLTAGMDRPVGMARNRCVYHPFQQGIARASLHGSHGILDQPLVQEDLDCTLRDIRAALTQVGQEFRTEFWPALPSQLLPPSEEACWRMLASVTLGKGSIAFPLDAAHGTGMPPPVLS